MKNKTNFLKRIGALLIVVTLIAGMTSGVVVSAGEKSSFAGSNAEGLLKHLGIIDAETPDYQTVVTRGQLAVVAAKVMNLDVSQNDVLRFYDVPVGTDYNGPVNALVEAGVINGDGGGSNNYRPHDGATLNEACKVFSVILGYDDLGYFTTYLQTAMKAGILDGIDSGNLLTFEELLLMSYNTLHADMMDITGVTVGTRNDVNYKVVEGYQAIERYHGLRKCTGVVSGASGTTLKAADDSIGSDQIKIGDKLFNWKDSSLLGKAIVFYCNVEKGGELGEDISYVYVDDDKTDIIVIDGSDSVGVDNRASEFKYYHGDKLRKVNLKAGYDIIYNGMVLRNETADDFKPEAGSVTLIDNNNDNVYDVVVIEAFEYIQISKIELEEGTIFSKFPVGKAYGSKDRKTEIEVYGASGEKVRPQLAIPGAVVAIRSSKCNEGTIKIKVNIIGSAMTGSIEKITNDSITLAGKTYKWTDATESEVAKSALKPGDMVDYYVHNDIMAMIFKATSSEYQYGILLDADEIDDNSFESEVKFLIVNKAIEKVEYTAAKSLTLDGVSAKTNWNTISTRLNDAANVISTMHAGSTQGFGDANFPLSQLVRYKVNSDGLLTHLDTNIIGSEDPEFTLDLYEDSALVDLYCAENSSFYTNGTGAVLDQLHFSLENVNNSIVVCDNDRSDLYSYKDSLSKANISEELDNYSNHGTKVKVEAYNVDPELKTAEFLVVYVQTKEKTGAPGASDHIDLVLGSYETLDEEGEVVRVVEFASYYGKDVFYLSDDYLGTSQFNIGDLVQVRKDSKNKIINSRDVYTTAGGWAPVLLEDQTYLGNNPNIYLPDSSLNVSNDLTESIRLTRGTIVSVGDNFIGHTASLYSEGALKVGATGSGYFNNFKKMSTTKVYLYDYSQARAGVQEISYADMMSDKIQAGKGDTAIMYNKRGSLEWIYVIR